MTPVAVGHPLGADYRAQGVGGRRRRDRWPARPVCERWAETRVGREQTLARLTSAPFVLDGVNARSTRKRGLELVLGWLGAQPGETWQDRWLASGAESAGSAWRLVPKAWLLAEFGGDVGYRHEILCRAVTAAISADLVRPSLTWLVSSGIRHGTLVADLSRARRGGGFARLEELCASDAAVSTTAANLCLHRAAMIVAGKGGTLDDVTPGDVLEFLEVEAEVRGSGIGATRLFYRVLHALGTFGSAAPPTLRELRSSGQRSPAELIDRYHLACRPIRDLLVDYLSERQPVLDYTSLYSLAAMLGKLFWADLEHHNPGISSLRLPGDVAEAWKQRLRTVGTVKRANDGAPAEAAVPRRGYHDCLAPVRAFYLDIAQWALEDPARWGPWVAPCPIKPGELDRRKSLRRRKSRMDARTRERLPVLPTLVRAVDRRRKEAAELLHAARQAAPGATFRAAGQTLTRSPSRRLSPGKVGAHDPDTGARRDLTREEDHAFWAFAAVEVLRATGIRIEELTELSHHSLVQYRLPATGEIVPLLQIAPSKTDCERLLLVSPALADVLSAIISRIRNPVGAVPLVPSLDEHERTWNPPAPLLFQHHLGTENQAISARIIRALLADALADTALANQAAGSPPHFTPHDFRRMFITEAVLGGLPPHIAQVIAGHRDINTTMGYKAVYPDEAIQSHLAFLARRRALRPTDEYRVPTEDEWAEFLGHFERRKVSVGTCGRAFGTPCAHEHACVRCPMLWPAPEQRGRIAEIRDNLHARIAEAEREGWLGEVEGLRISLVGAQDKLAQIDRRGSTRTAVNLGMPGGTNTASPPRNQ